MTENLTITIESRGKILKLGSNGVLGILAHDGLDAADREYGIVQNGTLDGGYVTKKRLTEREFSVTTDTGFYDPHEVREELVRFFNAADSCTVTIERNGITRWISAYSSAVSVAESNMYAPSTVKLEFVAPDPYLRGLEKTMSTQGQRDSLVIPFSFVDSGSLDEIARQGVVVPYVNEYNAFLMDDDGRIFIESTTLTDAQLEVYEAAENGSFVIGVLSENNRSGLQNDGDTQAGFTATLEFNLDTVDPILRNFTTGEYIAIKGTYSAGDIIEISTVSGHKKITLGGASITNRIAFGSTFFQLANGWNVIGFNGDSNSRALNLTVRFNELYLGI